MGCFKLMEEIRINRSSMIEWYYNVTMDCYRVTVKTYNREIYNRMLDKKHFNIYYHYINERVKYLVGEEILNRDYTMILLDNTMYKVLDKFHHMDLVRFLVPVDCLEIYNFENNIVDIVTDCSLRTGEVFSETDLVYHNGAFYNNGERIKDIRDFERDGVEYTKFDLMNGITKEQLDYIVSDYYSRDFEKYITKDIMLKIDRWY